MTKYIVKNCPSYHCGGCYYDGAKFNCCSKNDTGPIKQVVELCKQISDHAEWCNCPDYPGAPLANKILKTLDVQEVD